MRALVSVGAIALCAAAWGCGGEAPVAHLEIRPQSVRLGYPELAPIHVAWDPTASLDPAAGPPRVFVHLLDAQGTLVRTFDHAFPDTWREGEPVAYDLKIQQSALAPPLPAGKYQLTLGLYQGGGREGRRWPLEVAAAGPRLPRNEYHVVDVEVPGAKGKGPDFSFSGAWLPTEPGVDRQVLARRWLGGGGTIRLSRLAGAGSVWLTLQIPAADGPGQKLVFEDASDTPGVVVSSACGGTETGVSGAGSHEVEVPLDGSQASCEIRLKPNFRLLQDSWKGGQRAVALENAAWAPAVSNQ